MILYAIVMATFIQGGTVRQQLDIKPVQACSKRVVDEMATFVRVTTLGQMVGAYAACETSVQVNLRLAIGVNQHGMRMTDQLGNITEWSYTE